MGIDAEMLVKINGRDKWLSPERLRELCYLVGSTIGHDHFCISDEYGVFGPRHCLSIIDPWNATEEGCYEELNGNTIFTQDGDPIIASDDEQFVEVHFMTRYYGVDYERGDWPVIKATAELLERHIPACEIWYGGDSSGIVATLFDESARKELHDHFLGSGHRPYSDYFGTNGPRCPLCAVSMNNCGGGNDRSFYRCNGCGRQEVVFSGGIRRKVPHRGDLFDVRTVVDGEPVFSEAATV
jgi:hypothetical protein